MNPETHRELETNPVSERSSEVTGMHLFDENEAEEHARCGRDTTRTERMGDREYVNERLNGSRPRAVCPGCKALAMPLVEVILEDMARNFEDEGRLGDAEDCRELLDRLAGETDLDC